MPDNTAISNINRSVVQNKYYRFVIVVPSSINEDEIFTGLNERGWEVRSIGVPPIEYTQAAAALEASTGIASPKAFWIHATWRGPSLTLPIRDEPFYYGNIEELISESNTIVPPNNKSSTAVNILSFVVGVSLIGYGLWYYNKSR